MDKRRNRKGWLVLMYYTALDMILGYESANLRECINIKL